MVFNRERGEWPLVVGETTYKMRLTTNAMAEVEGLGGGKTWDDVIEGLLKGSVAACRLLLWAALRDKHPDVATDDPKSLQAVGDLIDEAGGLTAITAQIKAFVAQNAKPAEAGAARPPQGGGAGGTGAPPTPASSPSV